MKKFTPLIFILLLQLSLTAQVQWFQNQDGNNPYPNGTVATSVQSLTNTSFMASYLWHVDNDQFTWKISKTRTDGKEQKTFFVTGTTAQVEVRTGHHNIIYILEKDFPLGLDPQYTIFKLDTNLVVRAQRTITFAGGFSVFNLNAFKLDENDNLYIAGDGQYPDGPGFLPASFVMKTDKNLNTTWMKMDSTQTSYTDIHIDGYSNVWIVEDYYGFFPDVHISKLAVNGQLKWKKVIPTDGGRFSLSSAIMEDDNLLLYGGKTITDNAQGIYLWKISKSNGNVVYKKTHFPANGVYLSDLKQDRSGNIFALVSQYFNPGRMVSKVGRIDSWNGTLQWSRTFSYEQDSCNLLKLVVNDNDRFYVVGEKKRYNILSRGLSIRIKKNGQLDANYVSPDSVTYLRSHWLIDGIIDRNNQLISIGLTQDLDTVSYQSTYLRSFVVKFGQGNNNDHGCDNDHNAVAQTSSALEEEILTMPGSPFLFPNPVQKELTVTNLSEDQYDRLTVYNLQGSEVLQKSVNSNLVKIDVDKLPGGVYVLQLQSAALQKQKTIRFVVQK
jgi:Secretion system C-terminal sorting domain